MNLSETSFTGSPLAGAGRRPKIATPFTRGLAVYVIPSLSLYLIEMWGLWHMPNTFWGMYGNTDGMWAAWNLIGILQWSRLFDVSPFNPLSGMGSTFLPNLPWFNPAALSLGLPFSKEVTYVVSYTLYFTELCASNIILFRVLGLSPFRSSIGAQVYALVLFPPSSGWFGALSWFSLAPVNAHLIALANLILALFVVVGRYRLRTNVVCALALAALAAAGLLSAPVTFLTYAPTYALAGVALSLGQRPGRRALAWKLGTVAALGLVLWLLAFPSYLRATAAMSARSIGFPSPFAPGLAILSSDVWVDLWRRFDVCNRPQELLCSRYPIFWFHLLALAGAATQFAIGGSLLRPLATWFPLYIAFIHFYEFSAPIVLFGSLHVISTPYLVWSSYPFFALFFVVFAFAALALARRIVLPWESQRPRSPDIAPRKSGNRPRAEIAGKALLLMVVPAVAWYLWVAKISPYRPPSPNKGTLPVLGSSSLREPLIGPITRYLIDHASVRPGGRFRGYTATYFGDPAGHIRHAVGYRASNMAAHIYVEARQYLDQHYGNRFQEMDLWEFNIPTFEEYGQWVTRQAHAFAAELFSSPGDGINPVFLRIYRLDFDLLRLIGVRFLITDIPLAASQANLRAEERSRTAGPIYLYEIADPNLATYSPTEPIRVTRFKDGLEILRKSGESLTRQVVVFDDLRGPFLPARNVAMRLERGGFRITAESDGRSLLLVPVQFSRCFTVAPRRHSSDVSSARLLRANGIQTLVDFQGRIDARVRFTFGLLGTADCRLQDGRELSALGLGP